MPLEYDEIWRQKTKIVGLPYGEEITIVGRTMWAQFTGVTDRWTDRFCVNLNIFHGDITENVSGCFFSEHSVGYLEAKA